MTELSLRYIELLHYFAEKCVAYFNDAIVLKRFVRTNFPASTKDKRRFWYKVYLQLILHPLQWSLRIMDLDQVQLRDHILFRVILIDDRDNFRHGIGNCISPFNASFEEKNSGLEIPSQWIVSLRRTFFKKSMWEIYWTSLFTWGTWRNCFPTCRCHPAARRI